MNNISFEIEGVEYRVPQELTINHYQQLAGLELKDDINSMLYLVHVLTACPIEVLRKLDKYQLSELSTHIMGLLNMGDAPEVWKTFEFEGRAYGLIPNLEKMTVGEFADLDTWTTQDITGNMHNIMSVLYRPLKYGQEILGEFVHEIEDYDIDNEARAAAFRNLPYKYFKGVSQFFFLLLKGYIVATLPSLESKEMTKEMKQTLEKIQTHLEKHLDGSFL